MTTSLAFSLPWHGRFFRAQPSAAADFGSALPRPSWWQLHTGLGTQGSAVGISRLVWLYARAAAAECEGRPARANFLWRETYAQLRRCWGDETAWADAARRLAAQPKSMALTGASLRARWSLEVLLYQHCAFFNGHVAGDKPVAADNRAFFHGQRIIELLEIGGPALNAARHLLPAVVQARIDALRRQKRFDEALEEAASLARRDVNEPAHAERLAELHFEGALEGLKGGEDPADHRANAAWLQKSIDRLERARLEHRQSIGFYRGLARCHRLLAVSWANGGELATALGAIRMARRYDPDDNEAERLENELLQLMKQLQEHASALQTQLARQPGSQLNEEGARLVRNARLGLDKLEQSERSAQAMALSDEFGRARDREVWQLVGLPAPTERWEDRSRNLHEALLAVLAHPPSGPAEVEGAWQAQAAKHADLQGVDSPTVCAFLRRRLFDVPTADGDAPADPVPPDTGHEPVPPQPTPPARRSLEPVGLWLLSPRDWRVKLQVLVAAAAVGGSLALQVDESRQRGARDEAYASLRAAVGVGNDLGAVRAAEEFFEAHPRAADGRVNEVQLHYDQAFARWFVADGHRLDVQAQLHVERYRARPQTATGATP